MMIEIFKEFKTEVQEINGTKTVTYCHPTFPHQGTCTYVSHTMKGKTKPIKQKFFIMTGCDMGDVIEYIHSNSPLSDDDLMKVDKLIRDHSLSKVQGLHR